MSKINYMSRSKFTGRTILVLAIIIGGLAGAVLSTVYSRAEVKSNQATQPEVLPSELETAIENAFYARAEFFGADAIVPFPTAEARTRLAALLDKYPQEAQIFLKISELDEKLNYYEQAEQELKAFVELNKANNDSLEILAAYFHRHAQFEKEAATLERILTNAKGSNKTATFRQLIELARAHNLEKYNKTDFYRQIIAQDSANFAVIEDFIDKLVAEKSYDAALKATREYQQSFPKRTELLAKQIKILLALKKVPEAEAVYHQTFDPFWSADETEDYYSFLSDHDRLRAYENELKAKFKSNPADFDTAIRLFHFRAYDSDSDPEIFALLENARIKQNIAWQPDELLTISRILVKTGDGSAASRFLYTLLTQNKPEKGSALRAKILYQLFEILSDAGAERIALTKGDLDFYRDVAIADSHPGIATGILSLIFSDANPSQKLAEKEQTANKLFNRAAAYRIFQIYQREYPTSPELGQMYLDIVRLYTATNETEVAAKTLAEFEQRREFTENPNSLNYPNIALKLADAYIVAQNYERERAVYQNVLDYLGKKQTVARQPLVASIGDSSEPTLTKPEVESYPPSSNPGILIVAKPNADESGDSNGSYTDYLARGNDNNAVTYSGVLNRYVASLARENKTPEILALYASESKKYPNEPGLDEQTLQWLGQTNLVEEQLKIYRQALDKFSNATWQDRLARWFVRRDRQQDFESFSLALIEKLGDAETSDYLTEFVSKNSAAKPESFDGQLYLTLYKRAHARFPHNQSFVQGLLAFYRANKQTTEWRKLTAEYYFQSAVVREQFLAEAAKNNELRDLQKQASEKLAGDKIKSSATIATLPYKLFRADAAARLSNYEEAVAAYRELNLLYPNTPEYADRLVALTRSLGQINREFLSEAGTLSHAQAEFAPASADYRTRAGEIQAELGNYQAARVEWQKLIQTRSGDQETYLETATVFWDYFQYNDALETIKKLRVRANDDSLYAFESGAILEAKHNLPAALAEYIKALDGSTPEAENVESSDRAKRRLETLYARPNVAVNLQKAFDQELKRRLDRSALVLGYADLLRRINHWKTAARILKTEIARNNSEDFLLETKELAGTAEDAEIKNLALKRLAETAKNQRSTIKYSLRFAESLREDKKPEQAAILINQLVQKFPTNYGVLSEADDFYWRINHRPDSIRVLQAARDRAKGDYQVIFGRKLAARYLAQNNNAAAEQVLKKLYDQNTLDAGVYDALTNIYVRTNNRPALTQMFEQTLTAIKVQNVDFRAITGNVAELRTRMIEAFTRLKDYRAAVAQHIEIINRDADSEEKIDAAINYVKRYGGADVLANYYQKTAAESYKNYRWFVILAKISEANKDWGGAVKNYQLAIDNQPELIELYNALAAMHERQGNYNAAVETLKKTLEISNDDPVQLKRIITVLIKAGRPQEAELARQKLPVETAPKLNLREQFAEAVRLRTAEKAKAVEMSRSAFETLVQNPFVNEIKAADIAAYVKVVREAEPLDQISEKLWALRDKLILESEKKDSTNAGKARTARQTLDGAMTEAVGSVAKENATGTERTALLTNLNERFEKVIGVTDDEGTLALIQNLSRKAGFGTLEERILIGKKDAALAAQNSVEFHNQSNYLLAFYRERGDYNRILELLETTREKDFDRAHFNYSQQLAENSRLVGNREKELTALREYFAQQSAQNSCTDCALPSSSDAFVTHYFEMLLDAEAGDAGKNELRQLAENHSPYQIELINFLLARGEKELAHTAIENSQFSTLWKQTRNAQTALALGEFSENDHNYFRAILQIKPIGELIKRKPVASQQLIGDDWFKGAQNYGEWLYQSHTERAKSVQFLPAMNENRPSDAVMQTRLGQWYLERKDYLRAIEHLRLALEIAPNDKRTFANLGAAYLGSGDSANAQKYWSQIIAEGSKDELSFEDFALYLETLKKGGRAAAREKLASIIVKHLHKFSASNARNLYAADKDQFETIKKEIRLLADSFGDYKKDANLAKEEAAFFLRLSQTVEENALLPEFLVSEALIEQHQNLPFYELLIKHTKPESKSDDKFTELLKANSDIKAAEDLLDQQENYEIKELDGDQIKWQKERLDWLIANDQKTSARNAISEIEKEIQGRFARPNWLRLADLRLQIKAGNAAQTLSQFKRFVGITVSPNAPKIAPPSLERFNQAINLLRAENQTQATDELQTAFYARMLALEQFTFAPFVSLANLALKRGDVAFGLELLQIMTDLTDTERKETAAAQLAQIGLIKIYAADQTRVADAAPTNSLDSKDTLKLAAEIAGKFKQFNQAIEFRERLRALSPGDETNRLELARLFAENQNVNESIKILSEIINDRTSLRKSRWQAVLVASEICGNKTDCWETLKNQSPNLAANDSEMWTIIRAFEANQMGRADEANELLKAETGNAYLQFTAALFASRTGQDKLALTKFLDALKADKTAEFNETFGFVAAQPSRQIIDLYAETGQPLAALKTAETDVKLSSPANNASAVSYQTLVERAAILEDKSRLETLKLLASAAEQTGDFSRAANYERTRQNLLTDEGEQKAAKARIEFLLGREKETFRQPATNLTINQKLFSE